MNKCMLAFERVVKKLPSLLILSIAIPLIWTSVTLPAMATSFTLQINDQTSVDLELDIPSIADSRIDGRFIFISDLKESSNFYETEDDHFPHISISLSVYDPKSCINEVKTLYIEPGINNNSIGNGQQVIFSRLGALECVVSLLNDDGSRDAFWYFWYPEYRSFVKISVDDISEESSDIYNYVMQPIIDSLRQKYIDQFQDIAEAARLINNKDQSIPKDAVNFLLILSEIEEAQRRTSEAEQIRSQIYARLEARKSEYASEAGESDDTASDPEASEPDDADAETAEEFQSNGEDRSGASSVPSNQVVLTIKNDSSKQVLLKFFEFQNADGKSPLRHYPDSRNAWVLGADEKGRYPLTCTPGRIVCMGAEFDSDRKSQGGVYWGVSVDARESCEKCCLTCGGSSTDWNLTWDGKRHPPQIAGGGSNSSANAEALGTIIGTIGGAIIGSQRGPSHTPSAPPTGPNWRKSGISE